jgi:hypothetical protein
VGAVELSFASVEASDQFLLDAMLQEKHNGGHETVLVE